jgi:hypothetical protein
MLLFWARTFHFVSESRCSCFTGSTSMSRASRCSTFSACSLLCHRASVGCDSSEVEAGRDLRRGEGRIDRALHAWC